MDAVADMNGDSNSNSGQPKPQLKGGRGGVGMQGRRVPPQAHRPHPTGWGWAGDHVVRGLGGGGGGVCPWGWAPKLVSRSASTQI